jgi:hypothetical protein
MLALSENTWYNENVGERGERKVFVISPNKGENYERKINLTTTWREFISKKKGRRNLSLQQNFSFYSTYVVGAFPSSPLNARHTHKKNLIKLMVEPAFSSVFLCAPS